ncbi:MAG: hypothetical protein JWO60_6 [Frankiales bacterium]|nr:hypothetical protein [Frankiales bacterium]
MTPADAVRGAAGPVGKLGGAWMFDAVVGARGAELGLSTWSWYHLGRGGVLGDGLADAVVAAFGFFPPALQRKAWDKGRAVMEPTVVAGHYAQACADWGVRALDPAPRLVELLTRVTDAASPMGLPVFAGWRTLAKTVAAPDAGRLALALQVAREHRGGAHLVAVAAHGVEPLQAVMSGRYGAANAEFFGWPQPWPDPAVAADAMASAEAMTDRIVEPAFAVLSDDERQELVTGLRALRVKSGDT